MEGKHNDTVKTGDKKVTSSVAEYDAADPISESQHATGDKRKSFGGRLLKDDTQVFEHNAWDHVELTEEDREAARAKLEFHAQHPVEDGLRGDLLAKAGQHWDDFYANNEDNFFKDRKWLQIEFPEVFDTASRPAEASPLTIMEIGCGAGNTVFPILDEWKSSAAGAQKEGTEETLKAGEQGPDTTVASCTALVTPNVFLHACDFSKTAVDLVKRNAKFDAKHMNAFVFDLTSDSLPENVLEGSVDIIMLIFVFSALPPTKWQQALRNIHRLLKPSGLVLLRDYAHMDLAQLRMKKGRLIEENFYMRGDKTLVYFFKPEELRALAEESDFIVEQLGLDQRLLVNRRKQLRMNRMWLQAKFRKPRVSDKGSQEGGQGGS